MTSGNHHDHMAPRAGAPAGLETDGRGNVIPLPQRTPEDRAKAGGSVKNPEHQAEIPSPMPRDQQGQNPGKHTPTRDPAGQQGGTPD